MTMTVKNVRRPKVRAARCGCQAILCCREGMTYLQVCLKLVEHQLCLKSIAKISQREPVLSASKPPGTNQARRRCLRGPRCPLLRTIPVWLRCGVRFQRQPSLFAFHLRERKPSANIVLQRRHNLSSSLFEAGRTSTLFEVHSRNKSEKTGPQRVRVWSGLVFSN